jgi:hypothetical protein
MYGGSSVELFSFRVFFVSYVRPGAVCVLAIPFIVMFRDEVNLSLTKF